MATNAQGTRPANRPGEPTVVDPTPTPVVTQTGVGSVAVYDQDADGTVDTARRPSATMTEDRLPVETRSSGSMLAWIIGVVVLIILAYIILQVIF